MEKYIEDKIKQTAKIDEVIADWITLKRRGTNFVCTCPFHDDKSPSLNISPQKNIYKCFVCGKGGDPVKFVQDYLGLNYPDALKYLAKKYNIDIQESNRDLAYYRSIMHITARVEEKPQDMPTPIYIEMSKVDKYAEDLIKQSNHSNLATYLMKYFDRQKLNDVFALYHMGKIFTAADSVYWQIDENGNVRTAHIVPYDPETGHRLHKGNPLLGHRSETTWIQTTDFEALSYAERAQKKTADPFIQCLFGEHLLSKEGADQNGWLWKSKPIGVVESEKTALIMTMLRPEYIWVASCGMNGFSDAKMKALEGRLVTLFADANGNAIWQKCCDTLNSMNILPCPAKLVRMPQVSGCEGWDISDFELQKLNPNYK